MSTSIQDKKKKESSKIVCHVYGRFKDAIFRRLSSLEVISILMREKDLRQLR